MADDNKTSFFDILGIFDWITPLWALGATIAHDPTPLQSRSWAFFIPIGPLRQAGWSANDVEALLKKNGIETWAGYLYGGEYGFSVSLDQARSAEYILNLNGVPLSEISHPPVMQAMSNDTEFATMTIVPTPSLWRLLGRLIRK